MENNPILDSCDENGVKVNSMKQIKEYSKCNIGQGPLLPGDLVDRHNEAKDSERTDETVNEEHEDDQNKCMDRGQFDIARIEDEPNEGKCENFPDPPPDVPIDLAERTPVLPGASVFYKCTGFGQSSTLGENIEV